MMHVGTYNSFSQIKFKTTIIKPRICDYCDVCIIVKGEHNKFSKT